MPVHRVQVTTVNGTGTRFSGRMPGPHGALPVIDQVAAANVTKNHVPIVISERAKPATYCKRNLTIEDAVDCAQLAYEGKKGNTSGNMSSTVPGSSFQWKGERRWRVVTVISDFDISGFRAVLLEPVENRKEELGFDKVLSFAGTNFSLSPDGIMDVLTDVGQVVSVAVPPPQYLEAAYWGSRFKNEYGESVRLVGHSLGGGLARFASFMNSVSGAGVNSAPLGVACMAWIAAFGEKKADFDFIGYKNEAEFVSLSPGFNPGTNCASERSDSSRARWFTSFFTDHYLSAIDPKARLVCK